jgi:hypothetical protein
MRGGIVQYGMYVINRLTIEEVFRYKVKTITNFKYNNITIL